MHVKSLVLRVTAIDTDKSVLNFLSIVDVFLMLKPLNILGSSPTD